MIDYELPIKKGPFSMDELEQVIKKTENNKADADAPTFVMVRVSLQNSPTLDTFLH